MPGWHMKEAKPEIHAGAWKRLMHHVGMFREYL